MTGTGLSIAELSARISQLSREGVSPSEIKSAITNLCLAEGVSQADTLQRVEQAYAIWTAIEAVLDSEPKAGGSVTQDSAPKTPAQSDEPPKWLTLLLAGLQAQQSPRRRRQPDPDTFNGDRKKFPVFYQQLTSKVANDKEDFKSDKVACDYAFSRLEGVAASLTLPLMATYERDQSWDWNNMMNFFNTMFGDPHKSERARDKLFSMKQGKKNIRTHIMEFHELLLLSSSTLDEDTKMTIFRRSLDLKLQDKLIGTKCTKLDDLAAATIDIADQLYRIKLYSRESEEIKSRTTKPTRSERTPSPPPPYLKESQMEGVEYTGRLSSSIITRLKKEGRCFKCQKKGHLFAECPAVAVARATANSSKKRSTKKKEKELQSCEESTSEEESGKE